jgi:predicted TPR repeat methyltransferase
VAFGREYFEQLYRANADPWDYATSDDTRARYEHTLAALGPPLHGRTLEIGCSVGVFTQLLATVADELVAIDLSATALASARERAPSAELIEASFPEHAPPGHWDQIVCADVLYYLSSAQLAQAIAWLRPQLELGATLVVVSFLGDDGRLPLPAAIHLRLRGELAAWHVAAERRPRYVLDKFARVRVS